MSETGAKDSDGFQPPKYLASLIAAVNDGAKTAQAGALLFALVGVYLLATAFSASDEDLLRGRTVVISQIGVSLPPVFSFAIAPLVFVFLHIYTLARYDMLAANVRQFLDELGSPALAEADRERCRQLLANVEFIQALIAPRTSRLYSPVWRWLVYTVIVIFPVLVLLLVQINALRYQSVGIIWVQRGWLTIDLIALVWFFHRNPLKASQRQAASTSAPSWRWVSLLLPPAAIIGLNLLWFNVVPADADPYLVRYEEGTPRGLLASLLQPLDVFVCPWAKWGCRYLRVEHRTLVDQVWDGKVMADLRSGSKEQPRALKAVEGLVLSDRSLRFAALSQSSLFAADLTRADLRKADLEDAFLFGAVLQSAQLNSADLDEAQMQGADLGGAQLWGADLSSANLQGAVLMEAELGGADLREANLQGTNLRGARLEGADLGGAKLQGGDLRGAQLEGADLRGALLRGTAFGAGERGEATIETTLGLSDLRSADFVIWPSKNEMEFLRAVQDAITAQAYRMKEEASERLERLRAPNKFEAGPRFNASAEKQVLVKDPADPAFKDVPKDWLISKPTPSYTTALAELLTESAEPAAADGLARRAIRGIIRGTDTDSVEDRVFYATIACRFVANVQTGKVKLEQFTADLLTKVLQKGKIDCAASKSEASR
jgi:uncharacterized protein YjbI with pentapeptide repeats